MYGYKIEKGTDFNVSDNVTGQQKIIIGSKIAEALFENQEPIGNVITLVSNNVTFSFEVCGVLAPAVASNDANLVRKGMRFGCYSSRGSQGRTSSQKLFC